MGTEIDFTGKTLPKTCGASKDELKVGFMISIGGGLAATKLRSMHCRAVMDTNVLYAAFRSRRGASFEVFSRLRAGEWTAVVSNHLVHEYEEVLKANSADLGLHLEEVDELLNAICARAEEWPLNPDWQPVLADPDDEPLVQLAVESGSKRITTHNLRHLRPAVELGVEVLRPAEFLGKLLAT